MSVQAKVRCIRNAPPHYNPEATDTRHLLFTAVTGEKAENASWSKYTPAGTIEMYVTNEAAFERFEVNKEYLVTFAEA